MKGLNRRTEVLRNIAPCKLVLREVVAAFESLWKFVQRWVLEKFKEKNAMSLTITHVLEKLTCILDRSTSTLPNTVQRWDVVLMRHFKASKDNYSSDSQLFIS